MLPPAPVEMTPTIWCQFPSSTVASGTRYSIQSAAEVLSVIRFMTVSPVDVIRKPKVFEPLTISEPLVSVEVALYQADTVRVLGWRTEIPLSTALAAYWPPVMARLRGSAKVMADGCEAGVVG